MSPLVNQIVQLQASKSHRPSLAHGEREASAKSDFAYLDVPLRADTYEHVPPRERAREAKNSNSVVTALYTTRDRCIIITDQSDRYVVT